MKLNLIDLRALNPSTDMERMPSASPEKRIVEVIEILSQVKVLPSSASLERSRDSDFGMGIVKGRRSYTNIGKLEYLGLPQKPNQAVSGRGCLRNAVLTHRVKRRLTRLSFRCPINRSRPGQIHTPGWSTSLGFTQMTLVD